MLKNLAAGLYLVGTPIGNPADLSPHAQEILATCSFVYAEDTRKTKRLLQHYGIDRALEVYQEHNHQRASQQIIAHIEANHSVALVSDAGMPNVSDPGARITYMLAEKRLSVTVVPGPCAVTAALAVSGMSGQSFRFGGFLPRQRKSLLQEFSSLLRNTEPVVYFESPRRLQASLAIMAEVLEPDRAFVLCKELTKTFETIYRGTLHSTQALLQDKSWQLGEIVFVVGPVHQVSFLENQPADNAENTDSPDSTDSRASGQRNAVQAQVDTEALLLALKDLAPPKKLAQRLSPIVHEPVGVLYKKLTGDREASE